MSPATDTRHETRDLRLRPIIIFALLLAFLIWLAFFWMRYLFDDLEAQRKRTEESPIPMAISELPPEPRLQVNPTRDLDALRAEEHRLLHHYEWIDREGGLLRIPIEQAMKIIASRHRPPESGKDDP